MNLIEAAKLKRPFKRPHFSFYLRPEYDLVHFPFTWEDVLAEDWIIEEKEITITASQFTAAWANAVKEAMISTSPDYERIIYQQLKTDLGL